MPAASLRPQLVMQIDKAPAAEYFSNDAVAPRAADRFALRICPPGYELESLKSKRDVGFILSPRALSRTTHLLNVPTRGWSQPG
jgi:hypothetical protein